MDTKRAHARALLGRHVFHVFDGGIAADKPQDSDRSGWLAVQLDDSPTVFCIINCSRTFSRCGQTPGDIPIYPKGLPRAGSSDLALRVQASLAI